MSNQKNKNQDNALNVPNLHTWPRKDIQKGTGIGYIENYMHKSDKYIEFRDTDDQ